MILLYDFQSLYPCVAIGGHLYSSLDKNFEGEYWQGGGVFPSIYKNELDGVKGKYNKNRGKAEQFIYDLLSERVVQKKQLENKNLSPNEISELKRGILTKKIIINTSYGVMGSPIFKSVYTLDGASDITSIARRAIKHARTVFEMNGYECLYTDTDSIYILDKFDDIDKANKIASEITITQRNSFNSSHEFHELELESVIDRMYFFRDDKGKFIKKHYAYVCDGKVVAKGIKIVKGDCSPIAKQIYEDIIMNTILDGSFEFFTPDKILETLKKYIVTESNKFTKRYRVNPPETYKVPDGKEEPTSIQYQVAKRYGSGEHWLVANKRIGVGKGKRYATIEELKERYGDKWVDVITYETYMDDLKPFIQWDLRKNIHKADRRRV